ncbi:MAG: hypothetical protein ACLQU1_29150 [Bryobacteraceae bacterium]
MRQLALVLAGALIPALAMQAQTPRPSCRIGVFDSRAVAIAWARSDEGMQMFNQIRAEYEKAKAANDEKRMKELEQEGEWQQVRLHQQGFSTGPVDEILAKVKDKLPEIARQERLTALVSKWELPYSEQGVELVDVTLPLVNLFHPSEQVLKWVEEMKNQRPVPFGKLPLDPKM